MTGWDSPQLPDGGTRFPALPRGLLPLLRLEADADDGAMWSERSPSKGLAEGGKWGLP